MTSAGAATGRRAGRSRRGVQGERRIVTVLFCDVAGSTAMAEQLDPEEWAEIMNEAFAYMTGPVNRYEGTVARLMGDAILAFFGAPNAHEDDPERAILAGLDIVNSIGPFRDEIQQDYGLDFNVRVGINTGPVVVGDVGSEMGGEYTAMGDAVNLAARMEQTATPGTVQIGGDTHRYVEPLFDFESLGGIEVKGATEPVPAYKVLGRKSDPGSLRGIEGLSAPLIGRDNENGLLKRAVAEVRAGRGQIVCLIGEAGLGKSRLIEELHSEWAKDDGDDSELWMEHRGISYDTTRPYSLFVQHVRAMGDVTENESLEGAADKIGAHSQAEKLPDEKRELLDKVVNILLAPDDTNGHRTEGEAAKQELFDSMYRLWSTPEPWQRVALIMDDVHWSDPASVELLLHLFQLADEAPMLILCAFRPERQAPCWKLKQTAESDYPHRYTEIALQPLTDQDSDTLVDSLLTISDLPPELRKMILAKSDGNPFFVEEVVRTLIDRGAVVRDESGMRWHAATNVEDIEIPDGLQALLLSRIDRLDEEARRTLQLASVIGRSFYYQVLKLISEGNEALDKQLTTLQRVELIREATRLPELEYIFKHELTREAAYNSILRRRRRQFHRNVGEAIEDLFPEQLEEEAHKLAIHFLEARDNEKALKYFTNAGDKAGRLYANDEALDHYQKALELARTMPLDNKQLIHLYTNCGRTYQLSGRYDEAIETYEELEALGKDREDRELELAALTSQATVYSTYTARFDPEKGEAISLKALDVAREVQDYKAETQSLWNLLLVETYSGDEPDKAISHGEQAIAIAREHDFKMELAFALNDIARPYTAAGRPQDALTSLDEARELWRELDIKQMLSDNLGSAASTNYEIGNVDKAMALAEEALQISIESNNAWGEAGALFFMGPTYLERGEFGEGIEAIDRAGKLAKEVNFAGPPQIIKGLLAWVYAMLGDLDGAMEQVEAALEDEFEIPEALQFTQGVRAHILFLKG